MVVCFALFGALFSSPCGAADEQFSDPEVAVEAGREAIDNWVDYPWYDDATDDVAAIDVKPTTSSNLQLAWLGDVLYWLAWILLAAFIAWMLYVLIRFFLDRERHSANIVRPDAEGATVLSADRVEALPFQLETDEPLSDLLAEAQRRYANGDYDRAIVYLYSFQLMELDKKHVIHLTRGKTNRQYLRETRRNSRLGDLLQRTMVAFEDVFFGKHALSRLRFEACWSDVDDFQSQLRSEGQG